MTTNSDSVGVEAVVKQTDNIIINKDGKPRKKRAKPRKWTAEEEVKFLEGLNKYGRDWKAVTNNIETVRLPQIIIF